MRAGFGKADISVFEPGMCMFGWGHPGNVSRRVGKPLFSRAFALEHPASGTKLVYVCCDLGMISEALRLEVGARLAREGLGLRDDQLVVTATHTHSAPTGYSTYLMYALSAPGFSRRVLDGLAAGIVASVKAALASLTSADVFVHRGEVPRSEPVLFNRAPAAYAQNPEVSPVPFERRDEAVSRTMTVVSVVSDAGAPLGVVTWLGCHPTTIHREADYLHPDHKGESAEVLEGRSQNPDFVALFAQGPAGDVTANFRLDARRGQRIGLHDDDRESAREVGERVAAVAEGIAREAPTRGVRIDGPIDVRASYTDFFAAPVAPRFCGGQPGVTTTPPRVGLPFALGAEEGPGPLGSVPTLTRGLTAARRVLGRLGVVRTRGDEKVPLWELGRGAEGRVLGVLRPARLARHVPDRFARFLARAAERPEMIERPWVPRYLPSHLLRVGPLVVASLPTEPTTVAGARLARVVSRGLGDPGLFVVVCGYTDAYCGYLTTPEEYALQHYEGGATLYGKHALGAFCTVFDGLAHAMHEGSPVDRGPAPPSVAPESCVPAFDPRELLTV